MIPGFVQLGLLATLFQVTIVVGIYSYLKWRNPAPSAGTRTRVNRILGSGILLVVLGQFAALWAVGSLRIVPLFSLEQAFRVTDAGFVVMLIGYTVIVAGFILYGRAIS